MAPVCTFVALWTQHGSKPHSCRLGRAILSTPVKRCTSSTKTIPRFAPLLAHGLLPKAFPKPGAPHCSQAEAAAPRMLCDARWRCDAKGSKSDAQVVRRWSQSIVQHWCKTIKQQTMSTDPRALNRCLEIAIICDVLKSSEVLVTN